MAAVTSQEGAAGNRRRAFGRGPTNSVRMPRDQRLDLWARDSQRGSFHRTVMMAGNVDYLYRRPYERTTMFGL